MRSENAGERGFCPPGVYVIDAAQRSRLLRDDAFPPDFHVAFLDGDHAGSRTGFLIEIDRALRFPGYFGRNWDAVYDCLTDLGWLPAAGYVIVFDGFDRLAIDQPDQWQTALKVFHEACAFWRPLKTPMYILLFGPVDRAQTVSLLPDVCEI